MFARIARQYRRFLFASALLTAAGALAVLHGSVDWPTGLNHPVIGPLSWAIVLILIVGLPLIVLSVLLPGLLPLAELWLITLALLALLDPGILAIIDLAALPGWTYCIVLLAAFIIVERALYGPWLADLGRRDMARRSATLVLPGTPQDIWRALVPDPHHAATFYWTGATFLAAPEDSTADFILNLPRRSNCKDALMEIRVDDSQAPAHCRYRADPLPGSDDPAECVEITIAALDDTRCRVTYARQLRNVPAGKRLFYYLNHDFRDTLASLRARLSGRRDRSLQGAQMLKA